jgi:Beta-lactamase
VDLKRGILFQSLLSLALAIALGAVDAVAQTQGQGERAKMEAFVDGAVREAMRSEKIAGVSVAIVDHAGVVMARGYGAAAFEPYQKVDADTLFRVGSISKTSVWIARRSRSFCEPRCSPCFPFSVAILSSRYRLFCKSAFRGSANPDEVRSLRTPLKLTRGHQPAFAARARETVSRPIRLSRRPALGKATQGASVSSPVERGTRSLSRAGLEHTALGSKLNQYDRPRDMCP